MLNPTTETDEATKILKAIMKTSRGESDTFVKLLLSIQNLSTENIKALLDARLNYEFIGIHYKDSMIYPNANIFTILGLKFVQYDNKSVEKALRSALQNIKKFEPNTNYIENIFNNSHYSFKMEDSKKLQPREYKYLSILNEELDIKLSAEILMQPYEKQITTPTMFHQSYPNMNDDSANSSDKKTPCVIM